MSRSGPLLTVFLLVVALLGAAASLPAAEEVDALVGLDGSTLSEGDLAEGVTLLIVWASWSPHCRDIGDRVKRIVDRWGERARVVTINFHEDEATARSFARRQRLTVPVYLDPDAVFAKRHAVISLPFLIVIEKGEAAFSGKLPVDADGVISRTID